MLAQVCCLARARQYSCMHHPLLVKPTSHLFFPLPSYISSTSLLCCPQIATFCPPTNHLGDFFPHTPHQFSRESPLLFPVHVSATWRTRLIKQGQNLHEQSVQNPALGTGTEQESSGTQAIHRDACVITRYSETVPPLRVFLQTDSADGSDSSFYLSQSKIGEKRKQRRAIKSPGWIFISSLLLHSPSQNKHLSSPSPTAVPQL